MIKNNSDPLKNINEAVLTRYVAIIAIVFVSIRLITHSMESRYTDVLMNAIFIVGILYSIFLLKKDKVFAAKISFSLMFICFSLTLFYLRGLDMVPWLLVFPVGAILLFGVISGVLWCVFYILLSSLVYYFIRLTLISTFNLEMFILESITAFIISIVFASLYEYMKSHRIRKLTYVSNHDMLTGVFNRHFFYEYALIELEKHRRFGNKLALLSIDIDFFKEVNDTFGHAAGDDVLKVLSSAINSEIRKSDIFARLGGDEFVILLFDVDHDSALKFANKILDIVRSLSFQYVSSITVSIGLTTVYEADSLDSLMKRGDDALYEAKRCGRNQVKSLSID